MKLLHTSDWHVGKGLRGRSRADEHRAVLSEIADLAAQRSVDLVLVAGDLFETAAPTPESEQIVYRALLDLAATGAEVAVIAGNHDNPRRLAAVAPLLELGRVHLVTTPVRPDEGGVRSIAGRSGEELRLAMLPFVSQRGIVRAADLMADAAFEHAQAYSERLRLLIDTLAAGFRDDTANILMTHAFVAGGMLGGGERAAHLSGEYQVGAQAFPVTATYVALGHLHRAAKIEGRTAIHYCGSPLQLDFGEENQEKQVNLVDVEPGVPAKVEPVFLSAGRPLHTLRGSVAELVELPSDDAWLRVVVTEPRRAGLADEVRAALGERVVDVVVERHDHQPLPPPPRIDQPPQELFGEFLRREDVHDERVEAMFARLLDDLTTADL